MASLVTSTRPVYDECSVATCRRSLREREYVNVLAEAGVNVDRLALDLFLDPESCCTRDILNGAPASDPEYVERLQLLKNIRLSHPPPFTVVARGAEVRPMFIRDPREGAPTAWFLGAEPYYYLVERGENPLTILQHMHIDNEEDIQRILSVTDRPQSEFECASCGEYIPHYKYASAVYKQGSPSLLESPDRLGRDCCRDAVLGTRLSSPDKKEAARLLQEARASFSGIPIDHVPLDACISCGDTGTRYYHDYSWLTHHGVPSAISLNYFGLNRVCCRQATMNPQIVPRTSIAVEERALKQRAAIPEEYVVEYDYSKNYVPPLQGSL